MKIKKFRGVKYGNIIRMWQLEVCNVFVNCDLSLCLSEQLLAGCVISKTELSASISLVETTNLNFLGQFGKEVSMTKNNTTKVV